MNEFEYNKKYKRGRKTFIFLYIKYSWLMTIIGIFILFATYEIYFGKLNLYITEFLARRSDWYVDVSMVSLWLFLLGISVIFVGYIKANVQYRHFRFILDDDAFHLHRGLFFIKETTIPYKQISNVHIARPYHYRMFGVAQLDVVTAADKSLSHVEVKTKEFLIPVIDTSIARKLAKHLISQSSEEKFKDRQIYNENINIRSVSDTDNINNNTKDNDDISLKNTKHENISIKNYNNGYNEQIIVPDLAKDLENELEREF